MAIRRNCDGDFSYCNSSGKTGAKALFEELVRLPFHSAEQTHSTPENFIKMTALCVLK